MKILNKLAGALAFVISIVASLTGYAQNAPTQSAPPLAPATLVSQTPYAVVALDANSRTWQSTSTYADAVRNLSYRTNSYTEIATGLHHLDPTTGQWIPSSDAIQPVAGGGIATNAQYQTLFANDLNTEGAVDLLTTDGKRLTSQIYGLEYYDTSSGQTVLIAQLTNSIGQLLPSGNQVIYTNTFTGGGVQCDIIYTHTLAGLEQDLVINAQLPSPSQWNLNPDTTHLQLLTEFFDPPTPQIQTIQFADGDTDDQINFGVMQMIPGKAFLIGDTATAPLVRKHWTVIDGRTFLIEEIPLSKLSSLLDQLPTSTSGSAFYPSTINTNSINRLASRPSSGQKSQIANQKSLAERRPRLLGKSTAPLILASVSPKSKGLVLDYNLVTTQSNYDFQSDSTYFVTNTVYLSGTTVLEGGAVIKFSTNLTTGIEIEGGLSCLTSSYRPAVFTAKDDNTVGSTVSGSTGTPSGYYAYPMIYVLYPTNNLHNLVVKYGFEGIHVDSDYLTQPLSDLQILNCDIGIDSTIYSDLSIYNVLMYNDYVAFHGGGTYDIEQSTIDECGTFVTMGDYGATITNCVVANLSAWGAGLYSTNTGDYNGLYNTPAFTQSHPYTNATSPFQTVGAAAHYLASGCTFTNVGSSNINSFVVADIALKTTQPPFVIGNITTITNLSTNVTLSPLVLRDAQARPDLGYHLDPLDYALGNVYLTNANMTITPGTAIGVFSSIGDYGCAVAGGSQFSCQGSPTNLNHIAYYNTVQEQANTNWTGTISGMVIGNFGTTNLAPVSLYCRFTDWSVLAQDVTHFDGETDPALGIVLQDCQLHGGLLKGDSEGVTLTNCLLERVAFTDTGGTVTHNLQNNLFWRGSLSASGRSGLTAGVFDNMFDQTVISIGSGTGYAETNNAYNLLTNASYTNLTLLTVTNVGDVYLTNSSYLTGPLGNYYLPTNSPLINAGSNTADQFGLYYYTTATNQVPETNSLVDLGYHHVALTNGLPESAPYIDSTGTDFWVAFFNMDDNGSMPAAQLTLFISSSEGATGTVIIPGLGTTNSFSVAAGGMTNISIDASVEIYNYDIVTNTNSVHVTANSPVSVYAADYLFELSDAFTCYPSPLLGTNYCIMSRPFGNPSSQFAIVAVSNNTTVTIMASATADLGNEKTNYTVTLQQGDTYQIGSSNYTDDVTGTWIKSTNPFAVFAGTGLADLPLPFPPLGYANPLIQEQLPVESWGTKALALSFADRTNGDSYRVLAAYSNTVVTIFGNVVETNSSGTFSSISSNQVVVITNQAGQFSDIIMDGPVEFQGSLPFQVAHFANGVQWDNSANTNGDPCEILLPPTGFYLATNIVFTLTNNLVLGVSVGTGDFGSNYLTIIAPQAALNTTFVDGSPVAATNFVIIGTSGYYGAQVNVTTSGEHTVTSSQPVDVEVYGWGLEDSYGYFGGVVK